MLPRKREEALRRRKQQLGAAGASGGPVQGVLCHVGGEAPAPSQAKTLRVSEMGLREESMAFC